MMLNKPKIDPDRDITDCSELPRIKPSLDQTEQLLRAMEQLQVGPFIPECDLTTAGFIEAWLCLFGTHLLMDLGVTEPPSKKAVAKVLGSWGVERRRVDYRTAGHARKSTHFVYLLRHAWAWKYASPKFLIRHMILASPEHQEVMWSLYGRRVQTQPFPTWRDVAPPCLL